MIAAGCALVVGWATAPPRDIAMRFVYQDAEGRPRVLPLGATPTDRGGPEKLLSADERGHQRLEIPVAIGIEQRGRRALRDVEVRVAFPGNLNVKSAVSAEVGDDGSLIYPHAIDRLNARADAKKITKVDTLYLPYQLTRVPIVAASADDIPFFSSQPLGLPDLNARELAQMIQPTAGGPQLSIALHIEVFASGQRVASRKVTLAKPVALGDIEIEDNGDAAPVRASDAQLVARVRHRGRTLRRWRAGTRRSFGYREAALAGDRFQLISVDGSLRRVIVDRGSDRRADYELWYRGDGAAPDDRRVYRRPVPVIHWQPDWTA